MVNEGWNEIKRSMSSLDLCKKIINDYLKHEIFRHLEPIYGVTQVTLTRFVKEHEKEVKKHDPKLYRQYLNAKDGSRKSEKHKEKTMKGVLLKKNSPQKDRIDFSRLPKVVKYNDFLNYVLNCETGVLTGNQLIAMANERGIQVIN